MRGCAAVFRLTRQRHHPQPTKHQASAVVLRFNSNNCSDCCYFSDWKLERSGVSKHKHHAAIKILSSRPLVVAYNTRCNVLMMSRKRHLHQWITGTASIAAMGFLCASYTSCAFADDTPAPDN